MRVEQEEDWLAGRAITAIALLLIAITIATSVAVGRLLDARERALRPSGVFPERTLPRPTEHSAVEQEPFEAPSPAARQRERDEAVLRSFGWTDRAHGLARIPIDRAIDLYVAEEGAP
jgi:hypothetical protein